MVRAAGAALEEGDPAEGLAAAAIPSLDLGLGDDVRARVHRAASAYRGQRRPSALLLGSTLATRAALTRALLRGAVGLAFTAAVVAGHRWAQTPEALLAFLEPRCQTAPEACNVKFDWWGRCRRSRSACYQAGLLLLPAAPPPTCAPPLHLDRLAVPDVARGERLLRLSCGRSDPCSCEVLGERAYAVGDLRECVTMGVAIHDAGGVDGDDAGPTRLFRRACDAGELDGCVELGWTYARVGAPRNAAAAEFAKACNESTSRGCLGLGTMVREGTGVPRDAARAAALFLQACDGGRAAACALLNDLPSPAGGR